MMFIDAFGALLFLLASAALMIGLIGWWIWAAGDLFWMMVLKPWLVVPPFLVVLLTAMAVAVTLMPSDSPVGLCLPLLIGLPIATLATRYGATFLARWEFRLGRGDYGFKMDRTSLGQADLFLLIRGRQKARYRPPITKPPSDHDAQSVIVEGHVKGDGKAPTD